jgi:hypothetical protein
MKAPSVKPVILNGTIKAHRYGCERATINDIAEWLITERSAPLYSARSNMLARRPNTSWTAATLSPGDHGQAPRLARAKTCAAHIEVPKSNC